MATLLVALALTATAPAGEGIEVGAVRISPGEGGSTTAFTLELPDGAACPGDSANDGYRVQSYMVPTTVDPTTVTYDGTGPVPYEYGDYADFRQPLYDVDTNSFVSAQTADAISKGEPGPILAPPPFDFDVYSPGQLPPGGYHVGIACTLQNEVTTVWDTEIVVVEDTDDEPAQVRWTVADAGAATASGSGSSVGLVVGGAVAVLAVVGLLVWRRSRPRTPTPTLEDA